MDYREEVLKNVPNFKAYSTEKGLTLGGLGVAGEAGEVADLIKKELFHKQHDDPTRFDINFKNKLYKEMGDVYWYLEFLCAIAGVTRDDVMEMNVSKLRARHPDGWTPESQRAKADEKVISSKNPYMLE